MRSFGRERAAGRGLPFRRRRWALQEGKGREVGQNGARPREMPGPGVGGRPGASGPRRFKLTRPLEKGRLASLPSPPPLPSPSSMFETIKRMNVFSFKAAKLIQIRCRVSRVITELLISADKKQRKGSQLESSGLGSPS